MEKYRIKLDGTTKVYSNIPKKNKTYQMLFVYENQAGEKYASLVCDFGLVDMGYEPTGEVVYAE